ncbi:MAG: biopolymer transport protein ExbD [Verrucomicrobiota bacterium]|jgi:biopolymer transport protein ExbD|nr:biopolymer transport protein ExbD [Verrucomicrobiota bacterium]MDK2962881.1 biopolymer transport protein ExbD [Verrucomicrobiota bacterium]
MIEDFSLDKEFDEEIDLTPLIDVVFILLVFFFVTSTFIRPSLPVNLAKAASASASSERKKQLVITINADGEIFHDGKPLSRAEIPALLQENPAPGINLFVDRAAPFDAFLSVVDEARLLNREDISITTLPAGRE